MEPNPAIPNFRIEREIGRGGEGAVYLAVAERTGREVALKGLSGSAGLGDEARVRFRREADLSSKLRHPGIRAVLEFDLDASPPWIAMQYVEGKTLSHALGATDTLPEGPTISAALGIIGKVASALHAAHEAGIIHRDVKPGNILITEAGEPVLLDFGLAHIEESDLPSLTQTGDLLGTPAYMSPEQLTRKTLRIDQRTDIWSLGVVLFELLAKRRPFEAPTHQGLYQAILTREPPRLRQLNPRVPVAVEAIAETMLQKDSARRYSSAALLAADLAAAARGGEVMARRIGPVGRFVRWARREPSWASLLLLLILALPTIATLVATHLANRPLVLAAEAEARFLRQEELISAGYFEMTEGSLLKAKDFFEAAIRVEAGSEDAVAGLMMVLFQLGRDDEAVDISNRRADLLRDNVTAREIMITLSSGLDSGTLKMGGAADTPSLGTAAEYHLKAVTGLVAGHNGNTKTYESALKYAHLSVLESNRPRLAYYSTLAHAAMHVGDEVLLHDSTVAMAERWPHSALPAYWRAHFLSTSGKYREAIAWAERGLELTPDDIKLPVLIGDCYHWLGEFERELEVAEVATARHGNKSTIVNVLGRSLLDLGRGEEALERIREATADPQNAEIEDQCALAVRLGITLLGLHRHEEALKELHRALELAYRDPAGRYPKHTILGQIGSTYRVLGQKEKAMEFLGRAIRERPSDAFSLHIRAIEYIQSGMLDEAEADLRSALAKCPGTKEQFESRTLLGSLMWQRRDYAAALVEYSEAVRLKPDDAESHIFISHVHGRLGNYESALASMRLAHERGSKRPNWRFKSEEHLRKCEEQVAKAERVRKVASGEEAATSWKDQVDLAQFGLTAHQPRAALHLYREAFAREPKPLSTPLLPHRTTAARAAIASMKDSTAPVPGIPIESTVALSKMAREWLLQEVEARAGLSRRTDNGQEAWKRFILDIHESKDWHPVRDQSQMIPLGGDEMKAWAEFWARLEREREKL